VELENGNPTGSRDECGGIEGFRAARDVNPAASGALRGVVDIDDAGVLVEATDDTEDEDDDDDESDDDAVDEEEKMGAIPLVVGG
jgi:hypothetical protein